MILRRYGTRYQKVTHNFDSRAMTEVGFTRDPDVSYTVEEFEAKYERRLGRELTATAAGNVQNEVEDQMLASLRDQLDSLEAGVDAGEILVIEGGGDHPKTRGRQSTTVVEGQNRLVFEYTIEPPLRIGIYGPR